MGDFTPFQLGRYSVLRPLGTGGMAEVYLARQEGAAGFERLVTIKRVRPDLVALPRFRAMFLDEARITQQVRHPNIVEIMDLGEDPQGFYMVLEYVDAGDLAALLAAMVSRRAQLDWKLAVYIATGVLRGLAHAHAAVDSAGRPLELVHRDISPSNVLLTSGGQVKLSDFGIARARDRTQELTQAGTLKGKLAYLPPEALARGQFDRLGDQFCAATVLWEMLTLRRMRRGAQEFELIAAVVNGEATEPGAHRDGLPPALNAIVMRALSRDPTQRYASARDFERALAPLLRDDHPDDLAQQLAQLHRDLVASAAPGPHASPAAPVRVAVAPPPEANVSTVEAVFTSAVTVTPVAGAAPSPPPAAKPAPPVAATAPTPPADDDFFAPLGASPAGSRPSTADAWGPPPERFALQQAGAPESAATAAAVWERLCRGPREGLIVRVDAHRKPAVELAARLLVDGADAWPSLAARSDASAWPPPSGAAWLGKTGWLLLGGGRSERADAGVRLVRGLVDLVVLTSGGGASLVEELVAARPNPALVQEAVLERIAREDAWAPDALVALGVTTPGRFRQLLDARNRGRLATVLRPGLAFRFVEGDAPGLRLPAAVVPAAMALGVGAGSAPNETF